MGHVLVYTIGDVARRASGAGNGWHVLQPMGFDSFGLPAENAAIREGGHPREIVERNIAHITREMKRMGWAFDWDRVIAAHEPDVLPLDAVALPAALRGRARVPEGGAGEVVPERPGRARERAGARRAVRVLRRRGRSRRTSSSGSSRRPRTPTSCSTTSTGIDWPERIKTMQRNWIGRSEGAEVLLPDRRARRGRARLHDAARHAVRRDVLRPRAGASARRRSWPSARRTRTSCASTSAARARSAARSVPPPRRRRASSPASSRRIR